MSDADHARIRWATQADLPGVVKVHRRAFPGFFLTSIGPRALHEFYRALLLSEQGTLLVATRGGRVVGFAGGAREPRGIYQAMLRRRLLPLAAGGLEAAFDDPRKVIRAVRSMLAPGPDVGKYDAWLMSIAVDPLQQTGGVSGQLMAQFEAAVRGAGADNYALTTDADNNLEVNQFYLRRGQNLAQQYRTPEGRVMNVYVKDLAPGTSDSASAVRVRRPLRVGILTHICWPETADFKNLAIARALAEQGHDVTIITAFPNYPLGRVYEGYAMGWWQWQTVEGVRILRLPLYPDHSESGLRRMANYLSFTAAASTLGVSKSGPIDVLFVYSPPMTLGIPARLFKVFRGSKVLLDVVDLWPEAVSGSGMTRSRTIEAVTGWFARQAYRTADQITTLTPGFGRNVQAALEPRPASIEIQPPWSPSHDGVLSDSGFYADLGIEGKFCVVHTGNLGPFQDLETVIEAARQLQDDDDIRIVLVGGGRDLEGYRDQIAAEKLRNVVVTGMVPSDRIPGILAGADATLVSLQSSPYLDINVPSKVASYLAAGKPIVANASGEVADLVSGHGIGLVGTAGSAKSLAHAIRAARDISAEQSLNISHRARELHGRVFDESGGVREYVRRIEKLGRGEPLHKNEKEVERISRVYAARAYDSDPTYSDSNPAYLQRVQGVERLTLESLRLAGLSDQVGILDVLDFGCGNARWLGRWLAWGALPQRLKGVDVREDAIRLALESFPSLDLRVIQDCDLPFASNSIDVVTINLVFSSMLDQSRRRKCADEVKRVVRPGGVVLWYDLLYRNPGNPDVEGIPRSAAVDLWRPFRPVLVRKTTLAPPLARRMRGLAPSLPTVLEAFAPPLRTHLFGAFRKESSAYDATPLRCWAP